MKVGIISYGMGNIGSVRRAFIDIGADTMVVEQPEQIDGAERIVLPGVGAFPEGMRRLREARWIEALDRFVRVEHRPLLGICLGMQMLAGSGAEGGESSGLGYLGGEVLRLDALGCALRIPHVGWNDVTFAARDPLFARIPQGTDFYFSHSYAVRPDTDVPVIATADYGVPVVAAVRVANVVGTQFHPEKSSRAGKQLLRNFLEQPLC